MQVIAEAAKAAGSTDPQEVAEAIKEKGPFKTALGDLGFDEKGDITRPDYVMYEWKKGDDGKYTYVQQISFRNCSIGNARRSAPGIFRLPACKKECFDATETKSI